MGIVVVTYVVFTACLIKMAFYTHTSTIYSLPRMDVFCARTLDLGLSSPKAGSKGGGGQGGGGEERGVVFTPADLADLASSLAAFMYRPQDEWLQVGGLGAPQCKCCVQCLTDMCCFHFDCASPLGSHNPLLCSVVQAFTFDAIYHPAGFSPKEAAKILHALCIFQV